MSVKIKYNNYAVGAKESFVPEAENVASFVDLSQLQKYNIVVPNYANPCQLYQTALDGTPAPFPDNPATANVGIISNVLSDDDGYFSPSIKLTLTSAELFSSRGITLEFDKVNNIYPNRMWVRWFRNGGLLSGKLYNPNSSVFVCENPVELYNKIEIIFERINMPQNRLKLVSIDYGYKLEFTGKNLKSASLTQVLDPISTEITINTGDFALYTDGELDLFFQNKEPLDVYFNNKLRAKLFINNAKRTAKRQWTIRAEDYIGLLDSIVFYGGIYENKEVTELISEIFSVAKIPYEIDHTLFGKKVSGHIPYGTCREALMQVAFAVCAVVDTSNSDKVKIYKLSNEVSQTIPLNRIMQGQSFVDSETVTSVELTAHSYQMVYDSPQKYDADKSGTGERIFIKFLQPSHSLEITNGTIIESGANYAIINARKGCVLTYYNYKHNEVVKNKTNPLVASGTPENTVTIKNATLVSNNNVDNVLEWCYNYIVNKNEVNLRIVENVHLGHKPVNVGERITTETEYLGDITGTVVRQSYNLNGGILVKDTIIK